MITDTQPRLRDISIFGRYRVQVLDDASGALVEVHELTDGLWTVARGPARFPEVGAALRFAEDLGEALRLRVRREA